MRFIRPDAVVVNYDNDDDNDDDADYNDRDADNEDRNVVCRHACVEIVRMQACVYACASVRVCLYVIIQGHKSRRNHYSCQGLYENYILV